MSLRNKLYDLGYIRSQKVSVPVISIGNLTAGGTGKTPFTIFIASYFLKNNYNVGIISRGYGRSSDEMVTVYNGSNLVTDPALSGDELIEISLRLKEVYPNFVTVASTDRIKAAEYIIKNFKPDVIILDDAFQHRKIKRDLDIVMLDSSYSNDCENRLLPAGNLRESKSSLKRADVVINNYKFSIITPSASIKKNEFNIKYKTDASELIQKLNDKGVIAICGIAKPDSFFNLMTDLNIGIKKRYTFDDHYNYTEKDAKEIKDSLQIKDIILTTGKDYVKLNMFRDIFKDTEIIALNISAEIQGKENDLYKLLDKTIK